MTWRDIAKVFERIEMDLIASLKRNLPSHKAWEQREGFRWAAWQAEKIKNLERYRRENQRLLEQYSKVIDQETEEMLLEQFQDGRELEQVPEELTKGLQSDAFFGVNNRKLDSLINDIQTVEKKAESAALRMMDDVYRKTIIQAETALSSGSATLPQAIDMATKDFLARGITCIRYRNGAMVNIVDYAQMALRTAATRATLQGEAQRRAELGIDTVLVSQYGACSDTCLPWQGRVYIDDVWGSFNGERREDLGLSRNGRWYPLLSTAVRAGLFHPNCRHTLSTWYEGISSRPKPLNTEKVRQNAKLERRQREMERKIRKYKRLAAGTHDPVLQRGYQKKVRTTQREFREFISKHSDVLRRDYWREKSYDIPERSAQWLSDKDVAAINYYKSAKSYSLNFKLRSGLELTPNEQEWTDAIDEAVGKLPSYNGTAYRSLSSDLMGDAEEFFATHEPGKVVEYTGFTSASTEIYDGSMDIQIEILSKHGRDMRKYNDTEKEILFPRGTRFKVLRREGNKLYLEEE